MSNYAELQKKLQIMFNNITELLFGFQNLAILGRKMRSSSCKESCKFFLIIQTGYKTFCNFCNSKSNQVAKLHPYREGCNFATIELAGRVGDNPRRTNPETGKRRRAK